MYYLSSTHYFITSFIIFIVKSLVLFALHPSFFHCNLYYSFYAFFFSLDRCTICIKPMIFIIKSLVLFALHPYFFIASCTIHVMPFFFSLDRCTICIKPMIFIVKSLVLFTLHPFLFHSTDVLFAQYS